MDSPWPRWGTPVPQTTCGFASHPKTPSAAYVEDYDCIYTVILLLTMSVLVQFTSYR